MHHTVWASSLLLVAAACSSGKSSASLQFTRPALIEPNPNPGVPLVARLSVATSLPSEIVLDITVPGRSWQVVLPGGFRREHDQVPIFGLQPGASHSIVVTARDAEGRQRTSPVPLVHDAPPLPAGMPPLRFAGSDPSRMQAGNTLVHVGDWQNGLYGDKLLMLDPAGEILWWLEPSLFPAQTPPASFLPTVLDNGNLLLFADRRGLVEVDLVGNVVAAFWADSTAPAPGTGFYTTVPVDSFHHDGVLLPAATGARYAVLGTETRMYADYPTSEVDPTQTETSAEVVGDTIVELRADGSVLQEFRLLDMLDPYRMCYDTLNGYWDDFYLRTVRDWSHANGLVYDAADDAYLVSLRHQEAVIKIRRQTGQVEWILGPHERWEPLYQGLLLAPMPGLEWQYHQHAPQLLPDGSFLVFDNGNNRAVPPTPGLLFPDSYSRAVQFRVDEVARTAEQVWAYGEPPGGTGPSFYSLFVSSAYRLGNGNTLLCDGGRLEPAPRLNIFGRIAEIAAAPPHDVVFEVYLQDEAPSSPASFYSYRAFRMPAFPQ